MAKRMTSSSCQSYLTVVFLLVIIAVQCTCNMFDDLDIARYNQEYKRGIKCGECATRHCITICAGHVGRKRSLSPEPEDKALVSQDKYIPQISSGTCLLDSLFESLSEEGKDRIIKAFLESV